MNTFKCFYKNVNKKEILRLITGWQKINTLKKIKESVKNFSENFF